MHRRVRLTPLGYVVAAVLILLILGGLYLIIRGIGGDGSAGATPTPPLANTASASPSVSPDLSTSTSPGLSTQNPALGLSHAVARPNQPADPGAHHGRADQHARDGAHALAR